MSLKFTLWQAVFIKSVLLLPALPTHLQCTNPHVPYFLSCLCKSSPAEWKLHEHRGSSVPLIPC